MNDKEAIETIEYARAFNEKNTQLMIAVDMACDALQERIDRGYGCFFCAGMSIVPADDINYCPYCGRKLKTVEPAEGE